jgi:hypothetical protein
VCSSDLTTFRVHAEPGSSVDLLFGRKPAIVDVPGLAEDLLLVPTRIRPLGVVGSTAVVDFDLPVPAGFAKGFTFFAQGRVAFSPTDVRYTNSVPIVVR